jgi:hypothetical protein
LVGKPKERRPFWRLRHRLEDNIIQIFKKFGVKVLIRFIWLRI